MTLTRLFTVGLLALGLAAAAPAAEVSFRDVAAVLSKSGCNQGACHGNLNGRGGLKLSLRGEDPAFDYGVLTRDALARRTDALHPEESLLLRKALGSLPHEGGRRFGPESVEYALLRNWIAAGLPPLSPDLPRLTGLTVTPAEQILVEPADRVRLRVEAEFADGSRRDVTRLAVYEASNPGVTEVSLTGEVTRGQFGEAAVLVRYLDRQTVVRLAFVPARPEFRWTDPPAVNFIDTLTYEKLRALRMTPSGPAPDAVFLRRVYLDTLGVLPTADEARAFLADDRSDKRARLIDRLLDRPEFNDFWALKWADLLHNEEKTLDAKGVRVFHQWIRQEIADRVPLNEFARSVLAGRGSTYSQPAANFYRALRDPQARSEATAQVFLGVRLQCAKCHNHPFDRWTQNDYHQLAAFFGRVQYRVVENQRRDKFDKHEFVGEQVVFEDRSTELTHPRTGEPLQPKLLDSDRPMSLPADGDRLQALADWVADPANPFFARAQANRVWFHLTGRGLVEPNDDFRASNPPANPALLDALAGDLREHSFDLRHLVRVILNSNVYQASSVPNATNRDDEANFARALVRPLSAEQLLDALGAVLEKPVKFEGYPLGLRAGQLPDLPHGPRRSVASAGVRFLKTFGKPERLMSCECERSDDTTLVRAFQLITGDLLQQMLAAPDNRLGRLLAAGRADAEIIDEFYLAALGRPPSERERAAALADVAAAKGRRAALEDVAWGLVNAKEFLLRR